MSSSSASTTSDATSGTSGDAPRTLDRKMLSYLQAGARLTGCRSSRTITDEYDLVTPDGYRYLGSLSLDRGLRRQDDYRWVRVEGDLRTLLLAWQPDLTSASSREFHARRRAYLPQGPDQARRPAVVRPGVN